MNIDNNGISKGGKHILNGVTTIYDNNHTSKYLSKLQIQQHSQQTLPPQVQESIQHHLQGNTSSLSSSPITSKGFQTLIKIIQESKKPLHPREIDQMYK